MAGDTIDIVQICESCGTKVGSLSVKKENMMLSSKEELPCPKCKTVRTVVREVAGRQDSIQHEAGTFPKPPM